MSLHGMSGLLELPLSPAVAALLKRADAWWYCGRCRYVARDYPFSDHQHDEALEYDDAYPLCPRCGERWWMSVSGLSRAKRWAFVVEELPSAVLALAMPPDV